MNKENGNRISEGEQRLQQWLGSIHARSGDLAASEAKVVDLLLVDPLFVGTSTAAQVATRAGVSPPTVIRAARAIGFTGFTELKIEIAGLVALPNSLPRLKFLQRMRRWHQCWKHQFVLV